MLGISGVPTEFIRWRACTKKLTILCSVQHSGGTGGAVQQREGGGGVRPLPPLLAPHRSAGGGASGRSSRNFTDWSPRNIISNCVRKTKKNSNSFVSIAESLEVTSEKMRTVVS